MLFGPPSYSISLDQESAEVSCVETSADCVKNIIATIFVDATDNRLTLKFIEEARLTIEAINFLAQYLDEHFGGKQIFILPESSALGEKLRAAGFTNDLAEIKRRQLCVSSLYKFYEISAEAIPNAFDFSSDVEAIKSISIKNFEALVNNSGFSVSKKQQYHEQGIEAFQLMCEYSKPFALIDNLTKEIVAFCRATRLADGNFYMSDTLVNERTLGMSKSQVTAVLYKNLAQHILAKQGQDSAIYLIVPPNRQTEFQDQYGCEFATNVYVRFSLPQPGLQALLEREKKRLQKFAIFLHGSSRG